MLIVANGAFKSGSTWQYNILNEMLVTEPIPDEYLDDWVNPSIKPDMFENVVQQLNIGSAHYLTKNHLGGRQIRDLLLAHPQVRVFNIERDLRDVLVSAYHHHLRLKEFEGSFEEFYYSALGQSVTQNVLNHHLVWHEVASRRYYHSSYRALQDDFNAEVMRMGSFLGIALSQEDLERISTRTNIKALRVKYGEQEKESGFFRKGEMGDWVNYFTSDQLEHLKTIQREFESRMTLLRKTKSTLKFWWKTTLGDN